MGKKVLAIDPGNTETAWVLLDGKVPVDSAKSPNEDVLNLVSENGIADVLAIEYMQARGMAFSNQAIDTVFFTGRLVQAWDCDWACVYRKDVKLHICGNMSARDSNVRAAIVDLYGGKELAIGRKKTPGPLYGIKKDIWAALAVGLTYIDCGESRPDLAMSLNELEEMQGGEN